MPHQPYRLKYGCNGLFICIEGKRLWKEERRALKEYKRTRNYKPYKRAFTANQNYYQLNYYPLTMQKICTICNKPVKISHPAQRYHPGKCFQKASKLRDQRYRDKQSTKQNV